MAVHHPLPLTERFPSLTLAERAAGQNILLFVERPGEDGATCIETVSVLSGESIADIKLRLRAKKPWFSAGHSLVGFSHTDLDRVAPVASIFYHSTASAKLLVDAGHVETGHLEK